MRKLADAGVDSPRRDCLVLVEDLLGKDRSWVNAHADFELSTKQIELLDKQIARRVKREPLAYIRGKAWFYKRFFKVTADVMVPRPESESFIGLLKEISPSEIIDIGTGSGCLAITAKLELPDSEVVAIDIDEKALSVAKQNAKDHKTDIKFIQGSLLEQIKDADLSKTALIANLPYVPAGLITSGEINYEPASALFSGEDGLHHYRAFWEQISDIERKPKHVLLESLENQHEAIAKLAKDAGYMLVGTDILVQHFKQA